MEYRNTPIRNFLIRRVPVHPLVLVPQICHDIPELLEKRQAKYKEFYDRQGSKQLPQLKEGDSVRFKKPGDKHLSQGVVTGKHETPRSFIITDETLYSIDLHGHAVAFHGTASVLQETPWHSMELHDIPWNFMAFHGTPSLLHGTPWNSMAFHGTPWILHGTPWHSMELHGYSMDTPWEFRGIPWISIDFHGIPWISIDFHGFPWNSNEVFHTGDMRAHQHFLLILVITATVAVPRDIFFWFLSQLCTIPTT